MIKEKDRQLLLRVIEHLNFSETIGYDECDTEAIKFTEDLHSLNFISSLSKAQNGISKLVFNIVGVPYVIKTAFDGEWVNCINDEGDEYEDLYYYNGYIDGNYCRDELNTICEFNRNGFSALTPETFLLCVKDGREFYAQEKGFIKNSRIFSKPTEKSMAEAREQFKCHVMNTEWIARMIDFYGVDYSKRFFDWCENYQYDTYKDLHGGNYGVRANGTPIIIDFGGFND